MPQQENTRKVALVTGGSRGIGRAACEALAAQGIAVVVHYRERKSAADEVVASIQAADGQAIALAADLADAQATTDLVQQTLEHFGRIDIVVNNAGEMTRSLVAEMDDETWERSLLVNLTSAFRVTRACLPGMIARKWGRVINVASQVIYTGSANHAHYSAAKAGLLGFSYSLAKELGTSGITVNVIVPGRIITEMITKHLPTREADWLSQTPMKRLGQPEEVASAIAYLASDGASYITGATLNISGGLVMG